MVTTLFVVHSVGSSTCASAGSFGYNRIDTCVELCFYFRCRQCKIWAKYGCSVTVALRIALDVRLWYGKWLYIL
jgi:urea transporter